MVSKVFRTNVNLVSECFLKRATVARNKDLQRNESVEALFEAGSD